MTAQVSPASPGIGNPTSPPEVSWQTLFWITTTLALNSMTQPSGRVCGLDIRYRTYLRSSPFMCLLDIALTAGRIVDIWRTQPRITLRQSFHFILHERFRDEYPTEHIIADASQRAEIGNGPANGPSTPLRWLLFIMGPLPQAIRLASFKGVFWSKCIGFSFLFPWFLCEILIFLYARMRMKQQISADIIARVTLLEREPPSLDDDDRVLFAAMMPNILIFVLGYVIFVVRALPEWFVAVALMVYVVPLTWVAWLVCVFIISLHTLFKRFPWVGRGMLVAFMEWEWERDRDVLVVDDIAFVLLIGFLVNFLFCGVGYAYFYDGVGTVDPGWTGVFG